MNSAQQKIISRKVRRLGATQMREVPEASRIAIPDRCSVETPRRKEKVKKITFADKVYTALLKVPKGKVTTYKDLAHANGTRAYRAVGTALKNNPHAPKVPCHRVVASDGKIGGFMGETSGVAIDRKIAMLKAEGVICKSGEVVDFEKRRYRF